MTAQYIATIDPFPHQDQKSTQLHPFYDHLRQGRLMSTQCAECKHITWPPKTMCPQCASAQIDWVELPQEGRIVEFTIAERGIPAGFDIPTIFVLVQIGPVRILSRLINADPSKIKIGLTVKPDLVKVPGTPLCEDRVLPVFKLQA